MQAPGRIFPLFTTTPTPDQARPFGTMSHDRIKPKIETSPGESAPQAESAAVGKTGSEGVGKRGGTVILKFIYPIDTVRVLHVLRWESSQI